MKQNLGFEYMRFITIPSCFHEEPFREAVLQALELSSARRLPLQFLQLNGFVCYPLNIPRLRTAPFSREHAHSRGIE
jgi:hypothetical protein